MTSGSKSKGFSFEREITNFLTEEYGEEYISDKGSATT